MDSTDFFRVGAFQGPAIDGDPNQALQIVIHTLELADKNHLDILCMPETFLHGYFDCIEKALIYSYHLESSDFADLCQKTSRFNTTLLLGINEKDGDKIFNTVVVIENGKLLGKYRKAYSYPPYDYYSLGTEFPIFEKRGIKYGIIICYDSIFFEPSRILALKGARILFCPMYNRIERRGTIPRFTTDPAHLVARSFENDCWLVCSDVIFENDDAYSSGHSSIFSSNGTIIEKLDPFAKNILFHSIPMENLLNVKKRRLFGNPELFEIVVNEYNKKIQEILL